jgi:hypothetical protein
VVEVDGSNEASRYDYINRSPEEWAAIAEDLEFEFELAENAGAQKRLAEWILIAKHLATNPDNIGITFWVTAGPNASGMVLDEAMARGLSVADTLREILSTHANLVVLARLSAPGGRKITVTLPEGRSAQLVLWENLDDLLLEDGE